MFAGVDIGLAIAIGLSICLALWKSAFPHTAVLGRLPQTTVYRCVMVSCSVLLNSTVCERF